MYDNEWIAWSADFDKNKDGTYDYYNKVSISEPELIEEGAFDSRLEKGVLYTATLPNRNLYNTLLSIGWELEEI